MLVFIVFTLLKLRLYLTPSRLKSQPFYFFLKLLLKPILKIRQIFALDGLGQFEKIPLVYFAALLAFAMAGKRSVIVAVDCVIKRNFVSFGNISHGIDLADSARSFGVRVRMARVVDALFRRLHVPYFSVLKVIQIKRILPFSKFVRVFDNVRIINLQNNIPRPKILIRKHAFSLDV